MLGNVRYHVEMGVRVSPSGVRRLERTVHGMFRVHDFSRCMLPRTLKQGNSPHMTQLD